MLNIKDWTVAPNISYGSFIAPPHGPHYPSRCRTLKVVLKKKKKSNQRGEPDLLPQSPLSWALQCCTSNLIMRVLPVHYSYAKQRPAALPHAHINLNLLTKAQKGPVCVLVFHSKSGGIIKKKYNNNKYILQQCLSEENALQSFIGYAQSQERVIKKRKAKKKKKTQPGRDLGRERGRGGQKRIKEGNLQTFQTSLVERDEAKSGVGVGGRQRAERHILDKYIHPQQFEMVEIPVSYTWVRALGRD